MLSAEKVSAENVSESVKYASVSSSVSLVLQCLLVRLEVFTCAAGSF